MLQQQGERLLAQPLPGDRDNAFFRIDGVIPTMITNKLVQPMVRPFEKDIDHIPGFVYPFDHYFLGSVPETVFLEEAKILQEKLTDEEIDKALQEWPREAALQNGREIGEKLKHRRNRLPEYASKFSREIQKQKDTDTPLKGSEDLDLPLNLRKCFECK